MRYLLLLIPIAAFAQAPRQTAWDLRQNGAPTATGCKSSQDVGKRYSRINAATTNSTLYVCQNTGATTYAWALVGGGGVTSVFGRTGAVVAASGDYTASQVTNAADTTATYSNPAWISALAASKLTGLVPVANLGSGTANSTTCLYGDQTYKACGGAVTAGTGILVVGTQISINPAVTQTLANDQSGAAVYGRSITGTDAYAVAMNPSVTAYTRGMVIRLDPDTANLGVATIAVDGLAVTSILNRAGAALADGDIPANRGTLIYYNGTTFNVVGDGGGTAAGGSSGNLQYNNAGALGGLENTSRPNAGEILFGTVPTASATRAAVGQGIALVGGHASGTYQGINHSGGGFTGNWFNYQQGGVNQFRAMALMANAAPGMMINGSNFPAGGYGVCSVSGNCSVIGVDHLLGLSIAHNTDGSFNTSQSAIFPREGGVRLVANPGSKPTCALAARGTAWFTFSAAATKDSYEICAKDAADVYAWRVIY